MLLTTQQSETNCPIPSQSFNIEASPIAFDILSKNLYSDVIMAIVRELISNAHESTCAANSKKPIEVQIPNVFNKNLIIRDYGTGLSREDFANLYTVFFKSTKRNSNDYTGCFGLGSKVAYAYTDTFLVTSYFEGTKYSAICSKTNGVPDFRILNETTTDEPNGLLICIPIKQDDYYKTSNTVKQYLKLMPEINIVVYTKDSDNKEEIVYETSNNEKTLVNVNTCFIRKFGITEADRYYPTIYIKQGLNVYKLDNVGDYLQKVLKTENYTNDYYTLKRNISGCAFEVPIGTFDITPNREELVQNNKFEDKIIELLSIYVKKESYLVSTFLRDKITRFYDNDIDADAIINESVIASIINLFRNEVRKCSLFGLKHLVRFGNDYTSYYIKFDENRKEFAVVLSDRFFTRMNELDPEDNITSYVKPYIHNINNPDLYNNNRIEFRNNKKNLFIFSTGSWRCHKLIYDKNYSAITYLYIAGDQCNQRKLTRFCREIKQCVHVLERICNKLFKKLGLTQTISFPIQFMTNKHYTRLYKENKKTELSTKKGTNTRLSKLDKDTYIVATNTCYVDSERKHIFFNGINQGNCIYKYRVSVKDFLELANNDLSSRIIYDDTDSNLSPKELIQMIKKMQVIYDYNNNCYPLKEIIPYESAIFIVNKTTYNTLSHYDSKVYKLSEIKSMLLNYKTEPCFINYIAYHLTKNKIDIHFFESVKEYMKKNASKKKVQILKNSNYFKVLSKIMSILNANSSHCGYDRSVMYQAIIAFYPPEIQEKYIAGDLAKNIVYWNICKLDHIQELSQTWNELRYNESLRNATGHMFNKLFEQCFR